MASSASSRCWSSRSSSVNRRARYGRTRSANALSSPFRARSMRSGAVSDRRLWSITLRERRTGGIIVCPEISGSLAGLAARIPASVGADLELRVESNGLGRRGRRELVAEGVAEALIQAECLGALAGVDEAAHELTVDRFVQGIAVEDGTIRLGGLLPALSLEEPVAEREIGIDAQPREMVATLEVPVADR